MSKTETKKVTRKMVSVNGEKIPVYICPPGMSGYGIDLKKHFENEQEDETEEAFEVGLGVGDLGDDYEEDVNFNKSYQKYCDEGEITSPEVEDYLYQKQMNKYYDEELDREKDLVSIYNNNNY
jgi:hypothetical protein